MDTDTYDDQKREREEWGQAWARAIGKYQHFPTARLQRELPRHEADSPEFAAITRHLEGRRAASREPADHTGPFRLDNRIIAFDIPSGPKRLAVVVKVAGLDLMDNERLEGVLGKSRWTVRRWQQQVLAAGHDFEFLVYAPRPHRRYTLLPRRMLLDRDLSTGAWVLGLHLARCADDGVAQVGMEALEKLTGMCERSVRSHRAELVERSHIIVERSHYDTELVRRRRCNSYRFVDLEEPQGDGDGDRGRRRWVAGDSEIGV